MLCVNLYCVNCMNDKCYGNYSSKLVPYEFVGDIQNSIDNCLGFQKTRGVVFTEKAKDV